VGDFFKQHPDQCKLMVEHLDPFKTGYVRLQELHAPSRIEAAILRSICKAVIAAFKTLDERPVFPDLNNTHKYNDKFIKILMAPFGADPMRTHLHDIDTLDGADAGTLSDVDSNLGEPKWRLMYNRLVAIDPEGVRKRLDSLGREFGFEDPRTFDSFKRSGLEAFATESADQSKLTRLRTMSETLEWSKRLFDIEDDIACMRTMIKEVVAKVSVVQGVCARDGNVDFEGAARSVELFTRQVNIAVLQKVADEMRGWLLGATRAFKRVGGGYSMGASSPEWNLHRARKTSKVLPDAARVATKDWKNLEHGVRVEENSLEGVRMATTVTAEKKESPESGWDEVDSAAARAAPNPCNRSRRFAATSIQLPSPRFVVLPRSPPRRLWSSAPIAPSYSAASESSRKGAKWKRLPSNSAPRFILKSKSRTSRKPRSGPKSQRSRHSSFVPGPGAFYLPPSLQLAHRNNAWRGAG